MDHTLARLLRKRKPLEQGSTTKANMTKSVDLQVEMKDLSNVFAYLARASTAGTFKAIPPTASEFYFTDVGGRGQRVCLK